MRFRHSLILIFLGLISFSAYSQNYALSQGAIFLKGSGGYSSSGGGRYESSEGDRVKQLYINYSANLFLAEKFFMGLGLGYDNYYHDDYKSKYKSIGPNIGLAFGKPERSTFSYVMLGYRYDVSNSKNYYNSDWHKNDKKGLDLSFTYGFVIPIKTHFALTTELSYSYEELDSRGGNVFEVKLGFAGLLF